MSALTDEMIAALARFTEDTLLPKFEILIEQKLARASAAGDPDQLLDAAQVGRAIRKTAAAVRRAHERGTLGIEAVKVGKRSLRWRAGDVRALAAQGRR